METPMDARTWAEGLYILADERRSLATEGLEYAANGYDRHRYQRVLQCSARLLGGLENRPPESMLQDFGGDLHTVTPQIGVDDMVLDGERLLLIQRTDNGLWCMPGGAVDVGETLAQAAEGELREEAGIEGRFRRLAGVFDSRLWRSGVKRHMVHIVLLVERVAGIPARTDESLDVGYFAEAALPPLSHGHRQWLPLLLARQRQGEPGAYFDP
jgi:ADP-ribose pyrophosphatase YjhB (NUDIX family)